MIQNDEIERFNDDLLFDEENIDFYSENDSDYEEKTIISLKEDDLHIRKKYIPKDYVRKEEIISIRVDNSLQGCINEDIFRGEFGKNKSELIHKIIFYYLRYEHKSNDQIKGNILNPFVDIINLKPINVSWKYFDYEISKIECKEINNYFTQSFINIIDDISNQQNHKYCIRKNNYLKIRIEKILKEKLEIISKSNNVCISDLISKILYNFYQLN